jgi:hypothetical protein
MLAVDENEFAPNPVQDFKFHAIATAFPLIEGEAFGQLCRSVAENGLIHPITVWQGKIIDGRNRYRACKAVGRPLLRREIVTFSGSESEAKRLAKCENLDRRHLSAGQRAMSAEALADARSSFDRTGMTSLPDAAKMMGVGELSVKQARRIRKKAAPHIPAMVEANQLMLAPALKISELPMDIQNGLRTAKACISYLNSDAAKIADGGTLARRMKDAGKALDKVRDLDVDACIASGLTQAQAQQILAVCDNGLELFGVLASYLRGTQ